MKFHIVRNGESIDDIVFLYGLEVEELKKSNKHIRVWDKIIPGTKLRIPVITEAVELDISIMEPFIEDYYPKLKLGEEFDQEKSNQFEFQEIDNYKIIKTKNQNIDNEYQTMDNIEVVEDIKEVITPPIKKPIQVELKNADEEEHEQEIEQSNQQVYYQYYPYYVYQRYAYPKVVYPVYVYPYRR